MALLSPGVEVTVVDESNYLPAATNSVPYIIIATAENKASGTGTGVAPGTLAENAGRVYLVSSQRDLASVFGNPFFYQTAAGTPINGFELNEYGLLAAHSVLGVTNRAYVQRADINLAELASSLVRPTADPANGTQWLDTSLTRWGVFQWNRVTNTFDVRTPVVITNPDQLDSGIPSEALGSIGGYAVVVTNTNNPIYYKNFRNEWVLVGSNEWKRSWPTVQGTNTVVGAELTAGDSLIINGFTAVVDSNETLESFVGVINGFNIPGVEAIVDSNNRFVLLADGDASDDGSTADGGIVNIGEGSTPELLLALGLTTGVYLAPALQQSPNFTVPRWRSSDSSPRPTGSVWHKITSPNQGAVIAIKRYDSAVGGFVNQTAPIHENDQSANAALDAIGGGQNIATNSLYIQYNTVPEVSGLGLNNTLTLRLFRRLSSGNTTVFGNNSSPLFTPGDQFSIQTSQVNSKELTSPVTVTIGGSGSASDFVTAFSAANVPGVVPALSPSGEIVLTQLNGGVIVLKNVTGTPVFAAGFDDSVEGVRFGAEGAIILSNWVPLSYVASATAPGQAPSNGRYWNYSAVDQVDIMIHDGNTWVGYQNVTNDVRGFNLALTNASGPMVSAIEPVTQTDGTPLVYGDLWVDSKNLELHPVIKRWENINGTDQWVTIVNSDQSTSNGILFADARWAPSGSVDPVSDNIPTITSLLTSDYLDLDAPDPSVYPAGTLLWNTRRSGFNVKQYRVNYFNALTFDLDSYSIVTNYAAGKKVLFNGVIYVATQQTTGNLPTDTNFWERVNTNSWVTVSGNRSDGSPYVGRLAVRNIVVAAMKAAIDTQEALREEQNVFNLIAAPGYPELIPNMIALNNERSNTAFVVGDTPLRLAPGSNDLADWANNVNVLAGDGLTASDPYVGVFYPACQTNDLSGNPVVQPASHMILRTIIRSDNVSFPWLAPAGTRRGLVDNAARIGYVDARTGEFVSFSNGQGIRDVLYQNRVNPVTFLPGSGIVNYGNKTLAPSPSALDRINVARLVAFVRGRLNEIAKAFVFEPNDQITRNEIANAINGLMVDLVAKRGIYDYLVVCDDSNNTPSRIDRNELYVDIAIEPVKSVEFVFIPVRIKNTGEIAAGDVASSQSV